MQASDLVYHGFMDANRRHDIPGSETKESLLQAQMAVDSLVSIVSTDSSSPNSHSKRGPEDACDYNELLLGQEH